MTNINVSNLQVKAARQVDLYSYLLEFFPETVEPAKSQRLRNKQHQSLVITRGRGYVHNSTGKHGNAIDYLMQYCGYSFVGAVSALCAFKSQPANSTHKKTALELPSPTQGPFRQLYAYLLKRGINRRLIDDLVHQNLLYQAAVTNNGVCISRSTDFSEIFGTLSDRRYKGVLQGSASDGYWSFGNGPRCYVCESAIDAMSLFTLKRDAAVYCSMAGLKRHSLQRIIAENSGVIIAVDNDEAGEKFAEAHSNITRIQPAAGCKDWNDECKKT